MLASFYMPGYKDVPYISKNNVERWFDSPDIPSGPTALLGFILRISEIMLLFPLVILSILLSVSNARLGNTTKLISLY